MYKIWQICLNQKHAYKSENITNSFQKKLLFKLFSNLVVHANALLNDGAERRENQADRVLRETGNLSTAEHQQLQHQVHLLKLHERVDEFHSNQKNESVSK